VPGDSGTADQNARNVRDAYLGLAPSVPTDVLLMLGDNAYSIGTDDQYQTSDSGGRLVDMREKALPILEDWGVDLVLAGHSHSYERSVLLDSHYGDSNSLVGTMILDGGDGDPGVGGAYQKATSGAAPHEGAVYVVAGSSGRTGNGSFDHPVVVDLLPRRRHDGVIHDGGR
jgi:hypothetical protein